ncbi:MULTISPECIES: NADH-dependent flavin oxidoreductase [unclassified Granulicatella]|uniref:NADH-dependent flavin oxidoreductase n=1 Tax=unclassified Granulicatella TaxID=2630493 RepID=UPI0010732410|nr:MULTISPECIES: NADH-dependent flavin oxidoreductase [unclassified Granulicatella]MBF0779538.1 NADH-dependent flavin oxidoreductase [Granulicatella sp. 19428wC4_WM01]TFU96503.1 NADH-dependent flavin oxidoreductase [Granulicatella sp. WM01]
MKLTDAFTFDNGLTLKNRVVMAPMTIGACKADGKVSQDDISYYAKRAEHVGMIITGCACIDPLGEAFENSYRVFDESCIPGLSQLAQTIQHKGAKAILQIYHGGRMVFPDVIKSTPVAPSAIKAPRNFTAQPRALSAKEVDDLMQKFLNAIHYAIQAGFDGVELHGANTYLLQQFVSPHSNRRRDKWGGSANNRMRFSKTLVKKAKKLIADEATKPFILGYRFSPEEIEEPGITLHDTLQLLEQLIIHGIDYLHISSSHVWRSSIRYTDNNEPIIEKIVQKINQRVPLIAVGDIHTKDDVNRIMDANIPLFALGKALLLDPEWPVKIANDRQDEIITIYRDELQHHLALPSRFVQDLRGYLEGDY